MVTWLITGALCGLAGAVFAHGRRHVRRDQHRPLPRADARRGLPRRAGRAVRRDARRARDRPRHRGQRRLHRLRLQGRGRVRRSCSRCWRVRPTGLLGARTCATARWPTTSRRSWSTAASTRSPASALSQQFGVAGVTNFGFIIFQAAGAYAAAVLSLPPRQRERRVPDATSAGCSLPFPLPWIGAALVGGLLALPFAVARRQAPARRLRRGRAARHGGDAQPAGHQLPAVPQRRRRALARARRRCRAASTRSPPATSGATAPSRSCSRSLTYLLRAARDRVPLRPHAAGDARQRRRRRLARQEPAGRCGPRSLVLGGAIAGL